MAVMDEIREELEIEQLIANALNWTEYNKYQKYIEYISNNLEENSLVDTIEALMSIPEYYHISKLITTPKETIVVDCGCGHGIQQILFKDCYKYIGIDRTNFYKREKIVDNAEFIIGDIDNVLPKLEAEKGYKLFGISVLCCSYFGSKEFKNKFNYLVSI